MSVALVLALPIKSYPFWVVLVPGERLLLSGDLQARGMSLCLLSTCVSGEYPFQFQEVTPYKHRRKPSHKGTEANETTLGNAESSVSGQKHFQTNTKGITPAPEPVKRVNSKSKKVRLTPTVPSRARQGACWGRRETRLAGRRITRSHVPCNTHDPTGSPPEGFY